MHCYIATMEVVDTTSITDMEPQDERRFTIIGGPYKHALDARDCVPDEKPYWILKFEGVIPAGIAFVENYESDYIYKGIDFWDTPKEWEPHNLDTVFYELLEDARRYRDLCK